MNDYNYYEEVKSDVLEYIKNEVDFADFDTIEELEEKLNELLWTEDSVTGNASGSYTFNTYKAEENLCHNLNLLSEAFEEFGYEKNPIKKGAEWCDVTIRCYVLGVSIAEALKEITEDFDKFHELNNENE